MKRFFIFFYFIILSVNPLFCGDTARFVNLGFSGDGKFFMFAQHGFISERGKAYSDLFIVDVRKNVFTSGGVNSGQYETSIEPGQSSDGALFSLLEKTATQRKRYGISYLEKGRPLYIRIAEKEKESNEEINNLQFRDFETDTKYKIDLHKNVSSESNDSSFYIALIIEYKNGLKRDFQIGHPNFIRSGITDYTINRILLSPGEESLVFIISKKDIDLNVRYMIETVKIK